MLRYGVFSENASEPVSERLAYFSRQAQDCRECQLNGYQRSEKINSILKETDELISILFKSKGAWN
jgi:hypothetical protein